MFTRLTPIGINISQAGQTVTLCVRAQMISRPATPHIVTAQSPFALMIVGFSIELSNGAVLSILTTPSNTALICPKLPLQLRPPLIPYKKEKPDGHEQLLGGLRMTACMEMPGVPAAVYLVLQVTTVSPVEWMVCGWWEPFQGWLYVCVCTASVLVHVRTARKKRPLLYLVSGNCSAPFPLES